VAKHIGIYNGAAMQEAILEFEKKGIA